MAGSFDLCHICGVSKLAHFMVEGHSFTEMGILIGRPKAMTTEDVRRAMESKNGEVRTTSSTGAQKGVKPQRYDLIPIEALAKVAELYGKGAEKYSEHNWRQGYEWSKSYAAMQRHATQFWGGEDFDEEMGLPHLASVVFHALALMTFMEEHPEFDDRFKKEVKDFLAENQAYINSQLPGISSER